MYYFWRVIFWAPNTVCFIQFSPIWLVCALSILIQYNMSKDFVLSVLYSLSLWAVPLLQLRRELRSPTGALHHLYTTHLNEPIHVHHTQVHHLYTKHCYLHCCSYALAWVVLVQVAPHDWNRLDSWYFGNFGQLDIWARSKSDGK